LECGASGAKLVLLSKRESSLQVDHVYIEDCLFETRSKGKTSSSHELVRRLLMHKNLAGYQVVFIANEAVKSCFAILPKMSRAEMEGALLLQARKLLAWDGSHHPIMAYLSSEFLGNHTGNLVGLADWRAVKPWCRLIEGCGSVVEDLTLEVCAYLALSRRQGWTNESPVILVADLGAESSSFYILDHQTVRFMRKVPVGGDTVTKMLTTEISTASGPVRLTDIEAEEVKITGCLPQAGKREMDFGPDIDAAANAGQPVPGRQEEKLVEHMEMLVRPAVERLSSEIARSIQFYKDNSGQKVDAVYITGGTSGLKTLKKHLETSLQLPPVKIIDPFAGLKFADAGTQRFAEKNKTRLALAVGLALAEKTAISFLPPRMKIMKRIAAFMPRAVAALLLLGFFPFAAAGTYQSVRIQTMQAVNKQYEEQARQAGEDRRRLETLQQQFQEASDHYAALRQIGRAPLWPGIFNTLADAIPRGIELTRFSATFDQQHGAIIIEGHVLPSAAGFDDALAVLLPSLSASPFFRQVNIVNARAERAENSLGSFEIQCELIY